MASQKEYTMLFALNASLQSGFQATFGKAQQSITSLQKEINALAKQQSDISAYEKQQRAVENTEKKLEVLRQQYDNIQKEIQETEGFSSSLENKLLSKQQQIDKTSASLANQTQKLGEMEGALQEAGVDTTNLTGESKKLEEEMGRLRNEQDKAAESAGTFGERSAAAIDAISSAILAAGIADKVRDIGAAYMETVHTAANFEQSMSQVAATMGVTSEDVQELGEYAKQMGATTSFTAIQASEGLNILAMAGLNAKDQMAGLPTVLDLAAAGGMDMAESAAYITGAVKGFGDQMGNATYYADLMAKGATLANTNVRDLGEAFSVSAATASSYGQHADTLTLSLLRLADQNMVGSEAGRGLMQVMKSVYAPVDKAAKALDALGVSAYDFTTGEARDLNDVVDDINAALSNYSDEQANAIKTTIFSSSSLNAFNMMCASSEDRVESLWKGIGEAGGSASQQAATQLDNMNGELTIMQSAAEGLSISLGELYKDDFRELYSVGTEVLTMLNNFVKDNPGLVKGIITTAGALGGLVVGVTSVAAAIKAVSAASTLLAAVPGVGQIMAVTAAVGALAAGIKILYDNSDYKAVKDLTTDARELKKSLGELDEAYRNTAAENQATADTARMYIEKLRELESVGEMDEQQKRTYHNTLELLKATMPELADKIDTVNNTIEGGIPALEEATAAWEKLAEQQARQEYVDELRGNVVKATKEQIKNETALTAAEIKADNARKKQAESYQQLLTALGMTEDQFKSYYGTVQDVPRFFVSDQVKDARKAYLEYGKEIQQAERDQRNLTEAISQSSAVVGEAQDQLKLYEESTSGTADGVEQLSAEQIALNQSMAEIEDIIRSADEQLVALKEAYNEAYDAALKSVQGQYKLWDDTAQVVAVSADTINEKIAAQTEYWNAYNENLANLRNRAGDIEGLSEVIGSFADGSADSVNAIAGMAAASDEDLAAMVANYQDLQKAQDETSENIAALATNLDEQTQAMADSVEQMVSDMNLAGEAEAAARETIMAYTSTAFSMRDEVGRQFSAIRAAALSGLSGGGRTTGGGIGAVPVRGARAEGGPIHESGPYLVGEKGPEIVTLQRGQDVLPADETSKIVRMPQSGGNTTNQIEVTFQIGGNATQDVVEQLRSYGDRLAEQVAEILEERDQDRRRRAYA